MVAKPLCPLYKNIIKSLDRARYPELRYKVGLIAGIFFGLMFGLGGLGSAFFGWLADKTSIEFIFQVSAFLPLLGIIAGFLPNTQKKSVEETDENAK